MDLLIDQSDALTGDVTVPGDKSISHRAVIFGSLAEGVSEFSNFLMGEDCLATLKALSDMGVKTSINENKITIHGVGLRGLKSPTKSLNLGNSGTSARLLLGLLGAQKFNSNIKGDKSLSNRPMNRVMDPLRKMGMEFSSRNGKLPINIFGNACLNEINYELIVPSAQVKSAIIIASIFANKNSKITENHITRDHTERMMLAMNYPIFSDRDSISIEPGGKFNAIDFQIPGDFSSSVFLIVACLVSKNSMITIKNVGINPTRIGFLEIAKRMGADIKILNKKNLHKEPSADIKVISSALRSIDLNDRNLISSAIDEFPAIFILAAFAKGKSSFEGLNELRVKESDRIKSMAINLEKLGIEVNEYKNGIDITGGVMKGGEIECFDDHRVAMSFAAAGNSSKAKILIKDADSIITSFPEFVQKMRQINSLIEIK